MPKSALKYAQNNALKQCQKIYIWIMFFFGGGGGIFCTRLRNQVPLWDDWDVFSVVVS